MPTSCASAPQDYYHEDCPVLYALNLVGQKWKLPILWQLGGQSRHYNQLKRRVTGVTNTMLTKSLRELEAAGLVDRQVLPLNPPETCYRLTDRGRSLLPTLQQLHEWGATQIRLDRKGEESHASHSNQQWAVNDY